MDMNNKNINFHQTFYPNFDYIAKILNIADNTTFRSIIEISKLTGIPTGEFSGKVQPHINYSEYMNLIETEIEKGTIKMKRTIFGNLVNKEDPYFSEILSRLLCHMFLTSPNIGSGLWCFICRILQSKYGMVIKKNVVDHDTYEYFGKNTKLTAFNSCYSNEQSLFNLKLINTESDLIRFQEFSYYDEYFYALIFNLYVELKEFDANRSEYTVEEIFKKLKWNYSLNWSEKKAMEFFENASEIGWIVINRQLKPTTIRLTKGIDSLIDLVYSELI